MPYLTCTFYTHGGLKSSELQLWPSIHAAVKRLENDKGIVSRWINLYKVAIDGTPPVRIDISKIGFGDYHMAQKAFEKRVSVRIPKDAMGEAFELHQRYGKHEYVRATNDNDHRLMYCPSCGAFGFEVTIGYEKPAKVLNLLPSDFTSPIVFYLPELMEYLPAEMRAKLGAYLKAVGYGRRSPEKIVALDAMIGG